MGSYTRIAISKINMLINNPDCKGIYSISSNSVTLDFGDGKCTIDRHAKVTWQR